jgi:hypothetical protein
MPRPRAEVPLPTAAAQLNRQLSRRRTKRNGSWQRVTIAPGSTDTIPAGLEAAPLAVTAEP